MTKKTENATETRNELIAAKVDCLKKSRLNNFFSDFCDVKDLDIEGISETVRALPLFNDKEQIVSDIERMKIFFKVYRNILGNEL